MGQRESKKKREHNIYDYYHKKTEKMNNINDNTYITKKDEDEKKDEDTKSNIKEQNEAQLSDNKWKIESMISNIKFVNYYDKSPQEILEMIITPGELKNLNPTDYINKPEIFQNAPPCPEYTLPPTWEELFQSKCSVKAIDKLYIESKILKIAKNNADWYNETFEKWLSIVDVFNYQQYSKDFQRNIKVFIKKIESLESFRPRFDKNELSDNIRFYRIHLNEMVKINDIIIFIKKGNIYNLTPSEVMIKYLNQPNLAEKLPEKWEDLYDFTASKEQL